MFVLFFVSLQFMVHLITPICTQNDNKKKIIQGKSISGRSLSFFLSFFFLNQSCGSKSLPSVSHDLYQEKKLGFCTTVIF